MNLSLGGRVGLWNGPGFSLLERLWCSPVGNLHVDLRARLWTGMGDNLWASLGLSLGRGTLRGIR